jgi:hypothetical protein
MLGSDDEIEEDYSYYYKKKNLSLNKIGGELGQDETVAEEHNNSSNELSCSIANEGTLNYNRSQLSARDRLSPLNPAQR